MKTLRLGPMSATYWGWKAADDLGFYRLNRNAWCIDFGPITIYWGY